MGGSLVRGTATETSDVDIFIIINDTDVKRMSRLELKEKLRSIIFSYIQEATAIAGVKNILNVQTYLLTEFWEAVKDAHPVMFTFIRDGVPLYDLGAFLPWKSLLRMGKIKPSPEAIDMFMSSGDRIKTGVKRGLLDVVMGDIYWGVLTPTQGLLMLYGRAPGNVYDTAKEVKEIFVEKEKLLEKKYFDIFEEIAITYYKGYEHGKIKEVSGVEVDKLLTNAEEYVKRLKDLRKQIEKRIQEKSIDKVYEDVFTMLSAILNKKSEEDILKGFEEQLIKTGRFPKRFLESLKFIAKVKKEMHTPKPEKEEKSEKPKKKEKSGKEADSKEEKEEKEGKESDEAEKITNKEARDVEEARKLSSEIVNAMIEYTQRCDFMAMSKARFLMKGKDKLAEVFFLKNVFLVEAKKISKIEKGKISVSNTEELNQQLMAHKDKEISIDMEALETIKKYFGDFDLLH
jgi:hypothetical protein